MDINQVAKMNPLVLGFLQSVLIGIYTFLVGGFFYFIEKTKFEPGFPGIFLMLTLLVFSAAVSGSLVFGVPVFLAINKNPQKAISVLGYTLFFTYLIIIVTIFTIFSLA